MLWSSQPLKRHCLLHPYRLGYLSNNINILEYREFWDFFSEKVFIEIETYDHPFNCIRTSMTSCVSHSNEHLHQSDTNCNISQNMAKHERILPNLEIWSHDNNNFLRKYFKSFFHLVKQRNTPIKIWQLIPTVSLPYVFLDINEPKMFCWHKV